MLILNSLGFRSKSSEQQSDNTSITVETDLIDKNVPQSKKKRSDEVKRLLALAKPEITTLSG